MEIAVTDKLGLPLSTPTPGNLNFLESLHEQSEGMHGKARSTKLSMSREHTYPSKIQNCM